MRGSLTSIILLMLLSSCKKEDPILGKRSAATLDTPLSIQLDSMCLHAPNVITVNGDVINDVFDLVWGESPQSLLLTIVNPNGTIVFQTSEQRSWSGYDSEFNDENGPIPYLYELEFVTSGGSAHSISKVFYVVRDISSDCITADVAPQFGDQYDPRRCDVLYITNDYICIE